MKDWLFYPLIMIVVGAMIYLAMNWGEGPSYGNPNDGWVVKGADLNGLTRSPGTELVMKGVDKAVLKANFTAKEMPSQGVFTTLSGEYSRAFSGRKLELTIRARAADQNPSDTFQIALLTVPPVKGRFGWKDFQPTSEYQDFSITTRLDEFPEGKPVIYLGVWPDKEGKGGQIEVERFEVKPLD